MSETDPKTDDGAESVPAESAVDPNAGEMASHTVGVRYGLMLATEHFVVDFSPPPRVGDAVIIRSPRGVDWGEVYSRARPTPQRPRGLGEVLRKARAEDLAVIQHNRENREREEFHAGQEAIRARKLPMRLVGVEHLFSGEKIIFYFIADGRVDFRELVKDLARRYRTRIEMRQIGVRDEARLLADYEHCGRELCCRTFIRHLEPVTMRMAKVQKTTLDPTKISGHCGRLMCCLRFEDNVYTDLQRELPPRGATVATPHGTGEVINQDIIKQEVLVVLSDGTRESVHLSKITTVQARRGGGPPPDRERPTRPFRERPGGESRGPRRDNASARSTPPPATPDAPPTDAPTSDT